MALAQSTTLASALASAQAQLAAAQSAFIETKAQLAAAQAAIIESYAAALIESHTAFIEAQAAFIEAQADADAEIFAAQADAESPTENMWVNRCVTCNCDMGPTNPRQFCGKWRCIFEHEFE